LIHAASGGVGLAAIQVAHRIARGSGHSSHLEARDPAGVLGMGFSRELFVLDDEYPDGLHRAPRVTTTSAPPSVELPIVTVPWWRRAT
jgi:hypothetical protein